MLFPLCFQVDSWGVLLVAHLKYKELFLIALCFTAAWLGVRSEGAQTPKNVLSLSDSVIRTLRGKTPLGYFTGNVL